MAVSARLPLVRQDMLQGKDKQIACGGRYKKPQQSIIPHISIKYWSTNSGVGLLLRQSNTDLSEEAINGGCRFGAIITITETIGASEQRHDPPPRIGADVMRRGMWLGHVPRRHARSHARAPTSYQPEFVLSDNNTAG